MFELYRMSSSQTYHEIVTHFNLWSMHTTAKSNLLTPFFRMFPALIQIGEWIKLSRTKIKLILLVCPRYLKAAVSRRRCGCP